ncbi:MAG TPA: aspartate/glutamate racemase family protein [Pyrinomonadaceae bacterium]|nr:aspartate/glutamate racemase family protein [Pyrinomonadaceae bacterium]
MKRLGIIDWGIGGVSIYKLIRERLGPVPVTYFSDTGVTPYGKMARPELVARLNAVISFLKTRGVTHVLIGCNAASTAIPFLTDHGIPVEGVIDSAVETITKLKPKNLGLIGGRRTVVSGVYRRGFTGKNIGVKQRIAQPISGLIESGDVSSDKLHDECKRILAPLKNCSHILLACTHYPAIAPVIQQYVSAKTKLVDPAEDLVKKVGKWKFAGDDKDVFLTTGDATAMKRAARNAFGVEIGKATKLDLAN